METDIKNHLYGIIYAGGGGTRLWPLSTNAHPKQFLKLAGGERTLFQQTYDRVKEIIPPERIFVVTTTEPYARQARKQLPQIPKANILVEPLRRNTAMAVLAGTAMVQKADPAGIIANFWADHLIRHKSLYVRSLLSGAKAAAAGTNLIATGVKPTFPHTGLGYIKKGRINQVNFDVSVFELEKFSEKPDSATAKKMVTAGTYLWNVGLFIWRVDAILRAFRKHAREFIPLLEKLQKAFGTKAWETTLGQVYREAPETSIDYAVAEKAGNFLVAQGEFDWNDIGDFKILWELSDKDKEGNVLLTENKGVWRGVETSDSLISSDTGKFVGTVGVSDLIVVVRDETILVAGKNNAQKVKEMVELLKKEGKKELL